MNVLKIVHEDRENPTEVLNNLYSPPNFIRVIISTWMRMRIFRAHRREVHTSTKF